MVNEDIGKGRRRVAHIGLAGERMQQLANEAVDGLGLMFLVRRVVLVEHLFTRVHRGVVGFVVNHQQRQLGDKLSAIACVRGVGHARLNPIQKRGEHGLLLLDHKEPRALFRGDAMEVLGDGLAEIAVFSPRRRGVGF